jgi:hypothetical protein
MIKLKKIPIKKVKKKLESTGSTRQTRNMSYDTEITS